MTIYKEFQVFQIHFSESGLELGIGWLTIPENNIVKKLDFLISWNFTATSSVKSDKCLLFLALSPDEATFMSVPNIWIQQSMICSLNLTYYTILNMHPTNEWMWTCNLGTVASSNGIFLICVQDWFRSQTKIHVTEFSTRILYMHAMFWHFRWIVNKHVFILVIFSKISLTLNTVSLITIIIMICHSNKYL